MSCFATSNILRTVPVGKMAAIIAGTVMLSTLTVTAAEPQAAAGRKVQVVEGWTVQVSDRLLADEGPATAKALELLGEQLREIVRVVPAPAVEKLREIKLWFSSPYPNTEPMMIEYHPGEDWLQENGRDTAMAGGVELTNIKGFEAETARTRSFILHGLAHGYYDLVVVDTALGDALTTAYDKASYSRTYDRVEHVQGDGKPSTFEQAVAMNDEAEYFAENTEAFFARNQYFPFTRADLKKHDPAMEKLLIQAWGVPAEAVTPAADPAAVPKQQQ